MQQEIENVRNSEQKYRAQIRDMELDNDDLEKAERTLSGTLGDLETRYNGSLERCAMLEEELVLSARLAEDVQRLKDELRDANEELAIVKEQLANMPRAPSRPLTPAGPGIRGVAGAVAESPLTPTRNNDDDEMERLDIDTPTPKKRATEGSPTRDQPKWTPYRSMIPSAQRTQASPEILNNMTNALLSTTSALSSNGPSLPRSVTSRNLALANGTPPTLVRSVSGLPQIKRSTPKSVREERAQGVIKDLKSMTDRIKLLKARVDTRSRQSMSGPVSVSTGPAQSNLPRLRRTSNVHSQAPTPSNSSQIRSSIASPGSLEEELTRAVSPTLRGSQRPASRLSIVSSGYSRPTTPHRRPTTPAGGSFLGRLKADSKEGSKSRPRPSLSARSTSISHAKANVGSPTKKRLSLHGQPLPNLARKSVDVKRPASRQAEEDERW